MDNISLIKLPGETMRHAGILSAFFISTLSCKTTYSMDSQLKAVQDEPYANAGNIADENQPFHKYTWLTAHNAFNIGPLSNQTLSIKDQLERGVRGLMLDTHWWGDEVRLCHGSCAGGGPNLKEVLGTVRDFLNESKDAVITIHFEDYVSRDSMAGVFAAMPEVGAFVFNPEEKEFDASKRLCSAVGKLCDRPAKDAPKWSGGDWPTLQEMIDANSRLILLTQKAELSGNYGNGFYMFYDRDITSENYWSLGDTIGQHDYKCPSRWTTPLDNMIASNPKFNGWQRLFVMNHFHGSGEEQHARHDNRWDMIQHRVDVDCAEAKRSPNYIAVDFVHQGDVIEYVEWKNNGGIIAYEGNDATQDVVCGFTTAFPREFRLKAGDRERFGCENDEMRSITLQGMKAGQRVELYDHPDGSTKDDYSILTIKEDIPFDNPQIIGSLEKTDSTRYYSIEHHHKNGLDGKVSFIRIVPK